MSPAEAYAQKYRIYISRDEFILSVVGDFVDLSKFYSSGDFFVPFCVVDKKEIIM